MIDDGRRFWDTYWAGRPSTRTARTMTQVLDRIKLQYLQAILPGVGHTLEVGSGSGRVSCLLAMLGYQTVCLEFALAALNAAKANYAETRVDGVFSAGDAARFPFHDGTFDVVLSTGLLEHFQESLAGRPRDDACLAGGRCFLLRHRATEVLPLSVARLGQAIEAYADGAHGAARRVLRAVIHAPRDTDLSV